jgi:hypothetical protein
MPFFLGSSVVMKMMVMAMESQNIYSSGPAMCDELWIEEFVSMTVRLNK